MHYKCTELYDAADETGIAFDDPELAIPWPIEMPVLSDRDRRNKPFADYLQRCRRLP